MAGAWEIDLTDPVYGAEGIFAITGPTGAGKSTILDAAALALYGRTPRLDKVNKSENEIMTRRLRRCLCGSDLFHGFGALPRRMAPEPRARQTRGGPSGLHKAPLAGNGARHLGSARGPRKKRWLTQRSLNSPAWTTTSSRVACFLAQGDFAAFLKADADVRAATLEQLTGTEIYSRISIEVQQKAAAQMKALADLEERAQRRGASDR